MLYPHWIIQRLLDQILYWAEELLQMRDLRNQIAHEYLPEAVPELAKEVVVMITLLQKNIGQTEHCLSQRAWLG